MESFQPGGSVLIFEGDIVGKEPRKMADGDTKGKCKVTQTVFKVVCLPSSRCLQQLSLLQGDLRRGRRVEG